MADEEESNLESYQEVPIDQDSQNDNSETISSQELSEIDPEWQTDGLGLRGRQPEDHPQAKLDPWDISFTNQQGGQDGGGKDGGGKIEVTAEDASGYSGGGSSDLTNRDVLTVDSNLFEIYDGGGGQAVIKIKGGGSGTKVLGSIDGVVQWIDTTTC